MLSFWLKIMKFAHIFITSLPIQWVSVNALASYQRSAVPTSFTHPGIVYTLSQVEEYRANALSGLSISIGS